MTQEQKVDAIYEAMVGNEELGHEGLVSKVRKHDGRISRLERFYIYITGATAALVVVYTVVKDWR